MAKNSNLLSIVNQLPNGGLATIVGSSVADGMTIYVTFVRAVRDGIITSATAGGKVFLAETLSGVKTSYSTPALASALQKQVIMIPSTVAGNKDIQSTPKIDSENPLFSIASTKFLAALLVSDTGMSGAVNLFVQYYEE